jgi:hypothetical protein
METEFVPALEMKANEKNMREEKEEKKEVKENE